MTNFHFNFFAFLGLLSWDLADCHVDLEDELSSLTSQGIEGEEGKHGKWSSFSTIICFFFTNFNAIKTRRFSSGKPLKTQMYKNHFSFKNEHDMKRFL